MENKFQVRYPTPEMFVRISRLRENILDLVEAEHALAPLPDGVDIGTTALCQAVAVFCVWKWDTAVRDTVSRAQALESCCTIIIADGMNQALVAGERPPRFEG